MPKEKIRRLDQRPLHVALGTRIHSFIPGVTLDELIKYFFFFSALVSIVVLALIMLSLYRESIGFNPFEGFFGQSYKNIQVYRQAGLEYVDIIKQETSGLENLNSALSQLRITEFKSILAKDKAAGKSEDDSLADANATLTDFDDFATKFSALGDEMAGLVSTLGDTATATKQAVSDVEDRKREKALYLSMDKLDLANNVEIKEVDLTAAIKPLRDALPQIQAAHDKLLENLKGFLNNPVSFKDDELARKVESKFKPQIKTFLASASTLMERLKNWDPNRPVSWTSPISQFFFGEQWLTASFWQDYYGIIPLLTGSILISLVALVVAIPLGIGAGIYVNQIATPWEQHLIKPAIEFISAIPSVVLGFFGVTILGQTIIWLSDPSGHLVNDQGATLNGFWNSLGDLIQPLADLGKMIGLFPISQRLNILTAGLLLGFMAVPTIFTLTEDAINNVPRAFKEASFALGANRWQTIWRIILPASLSGVISAVLLGFGRVIGETMVVLLCAGNSITIPPLSKGLAVIFEPVHTMTGIIAQELGEVGQGSIHYHALFMVGLLLFIISLVINYTAQQVVRKFKISIG